jgi:hypothetical protein
MIRYVQHILARTKAEITAQVLKHYLGVCQNAGVYVMVTVYDMGTKNDKVLKLLYVSEMEHSSSFTTRH